MTQLLFSFPQELREDQTAADGTARAVLADFMEQSLGISKVVQRLAPPEVTRLMAFLYPDGLPPARDNAHPGEATPPYPPAPDLPQGLADARAEVSRGSRLPDLAAEDATALPVEEPIEVQHHRVGIEVTPPEDLDPSAPAEPSGLLPVDDTVGLTAEAARALLAEKGHPVPLAATPVPSVDPLAGLCLAEPGHLGLAEPGHWGLAEPGHWGLAEPGHWGLAERGHWGLAEPGHWGLAERGHLAEEPASPAAFGRGDDGPVRIDGVFAFDDSERQMLDSALAWMVSEVHMPRLADPVSTEESAGFAGAFAGTSPVHAFGSGTVDGEQARLLDHMGEMWISDEGRWFQFRPGSPGGGLGRLVDRLGGMLERFGLSSAWR